MKRTNDDKTAIVMTFLTFRYKMKKLQVVREDDHVLRLLIYFTDEQESPVVATVDEKRIENASKERFAEYMEELFDAIEKGLVSLFLHPNGLGDDSEIASRMEVQKENGRTTATWR